MHFYTVFKAHWTKAALLQLLVLEELFFVLKLLYDPL